MGMLGTQLQQHRYMDQVHEKPTWWQQYFHKSTVNSTSHCQ